MAIILLREAELGHLYPLTDVLEQTRDVIALKGTL